jgi:predicted GNAT family acetyltransferase
VAQGAAFVVREAGRPVLRVDVPVAAPEGAVLAGVVVDPAFRRRGLARAALSTLCARLLAAGSRTVMLHVAEENAAARALYDRLGFREIDRFRVAYAR